MRVYEKDSDRTAEVHIRVKGTKEPLPEFGEYVDEGDKAICCYVPVEEKQAIWISCTLSGTTQTIWCDAIVDGILRKANTYSAKGVTYLKKKKMDTEQFMYKITDTNFIETDMLVDQITPGVMTTPGDMTESIGTIELRMYVTRELKVNHTPRGIEKYYNTSDSDDVQRTEFRMIRPTLQMIFQQDSALLEATKIRREQQRADAARPGKEPWAIFRFHYRTIESIIDERKLDLSFDPSVKPKDQPDARALDLESVPPLLITAKKDDGDAASTKTVSPAPPDTPLTPMKGDSAKPATPVSTKKAQPKSAATPGKKMTLEQKEGPLAKPAPNAGGDNAVTVGETDKLAAPSTTRIDHKVASRSGDAAVPKNGTTGDSGVNEEETIAGDTIAVAGLKNKRTKPVQNENAEIASMLPLSPQAADDAPKRNISVSVMIPSKVPPGGFAPQRQTENKPKPINTLHDDGEVKPSTTATPSITPTKRSFPPMNSTIPDIKRAKVTPVPTPTTPTPTPTSRMPTGSPTPSPRPWSIERKVAEQRKALEAMRQKRTETKLKQARLDEKLKPYQKKIEEELERLRMEMLEEEALAAEDEEHLQASETMLAEFDGAEGGK